MVDEAKQEQDLEPTPYKNAYRKDLDKPVETETVETKDTEKATPKKTTGFVETEKTSQEHDFKKRYDDLKSHYDKKVNEWKEKENNLIKNQESLKRANYAPPKSLEELEQFKQDYPDVYEVVESVSHLQANDRVKDIENRLSELQSKEKDLVKETAYKELKSFHSDFDTLKESDEFTVWLNEQPESISDGIYKNNTDAKWAARVVDLYKADHNLQTKQTTKPNAAEAVTRTNRGSIATEGGKKIWSVSEIAKLRPQQFAKYEKEIDAARKEGRIEQA